MPEKITDFIKRLAPQYRVPQAAIAFSPLLAKHSTSSFIWPPLGGIEIFAAYTAIVIVGLFSYFPRMVKTRDQARRWFIRSLFGAVAVFLFYVFLVGNYVVTVDTPNNGSQSRSIGFIVEPSIRAMFPGRTDAELLMIGGLEDWQIKRVWTPRSVLALRICVLTSFTLTLALANIALGSAAAFTKKR